MGHEATGGVDGWGPVGVSLGLSLSVTLPQAVCVGVSGIASVGEAVSVWVVETVSLDGVFIGLGSKVSSSGSLLGRCVVWGKEIFELLT